MSTLAWADVAIMCAASLLFIGVLCTVEIVRQKLKRRRRARERRPICDACKTDHGHTTTRHTPRWEQPTTTDKESV